MSSGIVRILKKNTPTQGKTTINFTGTVTLESSIKAPQKLKNRVTI